MLQMEVRGIPHPRFPVNVSGFREPYAPFLKERRTRCLVQCIVQEIRGISQKTSEIWGTQDFLAGTDRRKAGPQPYYGRWLNLLGAHSCYQTLSAC
jgi:hypothetical protein